MWEQSPAWVTQSLPPQAQSFSEVGSVPRECLAEHRFAGFHLPLPVLEGPCAPAARAAPLTCPGCSPHARVGSRLSPCALLHCYLSWLQAVSNAPALKESLLAVHSALCQTLLHRFLCAPCASVPTRYWHWQGVTEENDGLSTALSFFIIIPCRIFCCNTKDHLRQ